MSRKRAKRRRQRWIAKRGGRHDALASSDYSSLWIWVWESDEPSTSSYD